MKPMYVLCFIWCSCILEKKNSAVFFSENVLLQTMSLLINYSFLFF